MRLTVSPSTSKKEQNIDHDSKEKKTVRGKKKVGARIEKIVTEIQDLTKELSELQLERKSLEEAPTTIQEGSIVTIKNNYNGYKGKQVLVLRTTKCRALVRTKSGTEFHKNLDNLE